MNNSRRLWVAVIVVLTMLLALGLFYVWLSGGDDPRAGETPSNEEGLIHIRSIYVFDSNRNLVKPVGVGADSGGGFYVTLRDAGTVVRFDRNGDYLTHFGDRGLEPGNLMIPLGVAADSLAGHVYVVDRSRFRVVCYDMDGGYQWEVTVRNPLNVTVGPDGDVYVLTFGPIVHLTSQGELIDEIGSRGFAEGQFDFPRAAVALSENELIVADTNNTRIQRVEASGGVTATASWVLGEPPRVQDDPGTRWGVPSGVTLDEQGRIIVLDGFRHRLEMIDPETLETVTDFGGEREGQADGLFGLPTGIARLYDDVYAITDTYNDRVQIVRLVAPEDRTVLTTYPWLKWLGLLLLLPLFALLGRKRAFLTEEALQRALDDGSARLILGVYRAPYVLPDVAERFADTVEGDVRLGDYLKVADVGEQGEEPASAEGLLVSAAKPTGLRRLLLARHRIVCADAQQCERVEARGVKTVDYDALKAEYVLADGSTQG